MKVIKKRKFKVDILTIFSTLLLLTCFTIILYSYTKNARAILELANQLILRTHQSVAEKLNDYLYPTSMLEVAQSALGDELIKDSELDELDTVVHMLLNANPQLRNMYVTDREGNIYIENRVPKNPLEYGIIPFLKPQDFPTNAAYVSQSLEKSDGQIFVVSRFQATDGRLLKQMKSNAGTFDPRMRPWYEGALNAKDHYWIGIYDFYGTKQVGVTISSPIAVNKKVVGVMGVDMDIDQITTFLNAIHIGQHSTVFISNSTGAVIAYEGEASAKHAEPNINRIANPVIRAAYIHFESTHESNFTFKQDGVEYLAIFTPYAFGSKDTWEIATVAPIDDFIGVSRFTNYQNVLFSIIMLLIGLVFVLFSANSISRPIIFLAKKTKDIQRLRFDDVIRLKTHIYEVQLLVNALNAAKKVLLSFSKYVPKSLVEQLIRTGGIAQLGGERKTITITFSDIVSFTQIAEQLPPEELMLHLSEYLNGVTEIIHANKGNVDKYIGDAVMSFWGAPLDDSFHPQNACYAMLSVMCWLEDKNKEWAALNKPVFKTRFAINTGEAIVGNMGSSDRLNYTALGDTVNLAARFESLNKIYGTSIIVSQQVYDLCHTQFLFRPIDIVKIRGKQQLVPVYELVAALSGPAPLLATEEQKILVCLSTEAYTAYHQQNIEHAIKLFREMAEKFPEDGMAKYYLSYVK